MGVKISADDVPGIIKGIDDGVRKAIDRGLRGGALHGEALLKHRWPVGVTGHSRQSWRARRGLGPLSWEIVNDDPIAGIIEEGARPHPVSEEGMAAILEWVRRKIALVPITRGARKGQRRKLRAGEDDAEAKRMANAIAWKLRREGQKGKFIVRDALEEIASFTLDEIAIEVERFLGSNQ